MTQLPPRILVVDDNEALRENLVEALHLEGYEVVSARDGASGLAKLFDEPFDAVLLDLMMPGLSGRDVLACIRAEPRFHEMPVVVTTGHSGPGARAGVPADAFLVKPFGVRELLAALRKVGVANVAHDAA